MMNSSKRGIEKSVVIGGRSTMRRQYPCRLCTESSVSADCLMCRGTKHIPEDSNVYKFLTYMLDFKLGTVGDYQSKKAKSEGKFMRSTLDTLEEEEGREDIFCDRCSMRPFKGNRYHCLECPDYDQCENCHKIMPHHHPKMELIISTKPKESMESSQNYRSRIT